jgi:hypothetical protein
MSKNRLNEMKVQRNLKLRNQKCFQLEEHYLCDEFYCGKRYRSNYRLHSLSIIRNCSFFKTLFEEYNHWYHFIGAADG